MPLTRIRQEDEEEEARRRRRYPKPAPPPPDGDGNGAEALAKRLVSVHPHGTHECYCPSCGYTETVAESVKCNTRSCPQCGSRMRASETGEYRSTRGISQVEAVPVAPLLVTFGLIGLMAYAIVKRPFG